VARKHRGLKSFLTRVRRRFGGQPTRSQVDVLFGELDPVSQLTIDPVLEHEDRRLR
jgi:hypothetical protein